MDLTKNGELKKETENFLIAAHVRSSSAHQCH